MPRLLQRLPPSRSLALAATLSAALLSVGCATTATGGPEATQAATDPIASTRGTEPTESSAARPVKLTPEGKPVRSEAPAAGVTTLSVPSIVSEPSPATHPPTLTVETSDSRGITAFEVPGPARARPKGRGLPAVEPGSASQSHSGPIAADPPAPLAPPLFSSFDSLDFDDNSTLAGSYFIPPDAHGAAGANHVVAVTNAALRFHTKAGAITFTDDLSDFFSGLAPLTDTFDPKVIYDQFADRFLIVTLEQTDVAFGDAADTSRIFLAVSDDGDPNGLWTVTAIDSKLALATSSWADYPGFAVDEEAVYITANMFGFFSFGGGFNGVRLWIVDKGEVGGFYAGLGAGVSLFDPYAVSGLALTTQPAHVFCTPDSTCPTSTGTYLVSYSALTDTSTGIEYVQSVRVDNPLGGTTFSQQFLAIGDIEPLLGSLPPAPQSGSTFPISTNNRRALDAVWRDDNSLWMTATIEPNAATSPADVGEATAYWWQLDTTTLGAISLVQQGSISGDTDIAADTHTFFPSIAVNSANDVAIGFSASAPTIFPGSYYTTRVAGDAAGFTEPAIPLRAGLATYERTFESPGDCTDPDSEVDSRWGDYSGMSLDLADMCFWAYNQHAITRGTPLAGVCGDLAPPTTEDGRWGTAFGKLCVNCPAGTLTISTATSTARTERAADIVVAGTGDVTAGGDLTLEGQTIAFENDLTVEGELTVFTGFCPQ